MLARNMLSMSGLSLYRNAVQFGMNVAIAAFVLPGDYGLIVFTTPFLVLIAMLTDLGMTSAITRAPTLSRDEAEPKRQSADEAFITTFVFNVRNIPAALYKALGGFATNGINMTKLESYMVGGSFTATEFYADIEGHPDDANVARALDELRYFTSACDILGVYPADPSRA